MYIFSNVNVFIVTLLQNMYITDGQNYTQFCGYELKCDKNNTDFGRLNESCCQPCECDDICLERGTCCADKDGRTRNVAKQQCVPGGYVRSGDLISDSQWYFVRASCPDTFTNLSVKHKCEKETVETLDDVVFVSSEDGSIVYKNKFCGLCHGEKITLPWNVEMMNNCLRLFLVEDMTETYLNEILLTKCHLYFKRPHVFSLHTVCFENAIKECNKTGLWERYDSKLESLCLDPPETVYYYDTMKYVYSNLYCYICNAPANVRPKTCETSDIEGKTTSLSILFDFKKSFEETDQKHIRTMSSNPCTQDQIYDTFLGTCKQLFCPILFLPINGQCLRYIGGEDLSTFRQSIRLKPEEHHNVTESLKIELKSKFNNIMRQLGFGKCVICFANMFLKKKPDSIELSKLYVIFGLYTDHKCNVEYIYSKLYTLEKGSSYVAVMVNQTSIRLKVFIDNDRHRMLKGYDLVPVSKSSFCTSFPLGRGSSCPKVKLSMEEYFHVLSNHSNAEKLLIYPSNDDHNETMEVCIEDYVVVTGKSSGNDNTLAISVLAVLVLRLSLELKY